jgi:hypothetical protein
MLDALRLELETAMAFLGATTVEDLRRLQRMDRPC